MPEIFFVASNISLYEPNATAPLARRGIMVTNGQIYMGRVETELGKINSLTNEAKPKNAQERMAVSQLSSKKQKEKVIKSVIAAVDNICEKPAVSNTPISLSKIIATVIVASMTAYFATEKALLLFTIKSPISSTVGTNIFFGKKIKIVVPFDCSIRPKSIVPYYRQKYKYILFISNKLGAKSTKLVAKNKPFRVLERLALLWE